MRKLSVPRGAAGERRLGAVAFEVAALMSRAASLWRALGDAGPLARGGAAAARLEGVRVLVSDDDATLLALALAEAACACGSLARAVARLAARCADPLLRRFDPLFAALVAGGARADRHGVRYGDARKMDRKARKMQRLVAATACLCHEMDVLAELEQGLRRCGRQRGGGGGATAAGAAARRVARQRQEVERLRAASLWNRTFDYAVRLLARSLFTIVARVIEVFDLEPTTSVDSSSSNSSSKLSRLSWSSSFVGTSMTQSMSMVYPSDDAATEEPDTRMQRVKAGKVTTAAGDARRFLMSRSRSLKQLKWPAAAGKHLIGCVVAGGKSPPPPSTSKWSHLPLSFSYVSSGAISHDDYTYSSTNFPLFQPQHHHRANSSKLTTSVFECSRDALASAPEASLGAAALAPRYAHLVILIERLAAAPHHICSDERDELYGLLTDRLRASLRPRLRALARSAPPCDPVLAAEWADTVDRVLGWLAPLAHNTVRWQAERNFEQRNVAASGSVLLLQTLHFADRSKTEAALTELLVGLNYLWRSGREIEAARAKAESAVSGDYQDCLA